MAKDEHAIVKGIVITRKKLIELIVGAVFLAFGITLIAGQILASVTSAPFVIIPIGVVLCIGSILYLTARLLGKRIENRTYEAFLIYSERKNELLAVPRYIFSENIREYMEGAFAENPALKTIWNKESLKDFPSTLNQAPPTDKNKRRKSAQLLSEAVEYFVLSTLSIHLADYFAAESFKKEELKEYRRKDIPEVLLSNRFLELFSRPREDRLAFAEEAFKGKEGIAIAAVDTSTWKYGDIKKYRDIGECDEIVKIYSPSGAIYDRFDLVLPKKSTVKRAENNRIEIETKKLKMSVAIRFEGFCAVLPEGFKEHYLGIKDWPESTSDYKVNVDVQITMKLGALFSGVGWEYYRWVDSFLEEIEKDMSEDAFFKKIDWESAFTVLQCLEQAQQRQSKKKPQK